MSGGGVLSRMASSSDPQHRSWAAYAIRRLSATDNADLADRLARDRNADVRGEALAALIAIAPNRMQSHLPRLRRELRSPDYLAPAHAMWLLAESGDRDALASIERLATDETRDPWFRKTASVVLLLIRGQVDTVLQLFREHDHDRMPQLARAAYLIGSQASDDVLEECARRAPDTECRDACGEFWIRAQTRASGSS